MLVETRVAGKRIRLLDRWSVPGLPAGGEAGGDGLTLRELIARLARAELAAFDERRRRRRLVSILSQREIADGATQGKIDPGGRPLGPTVDAETAVGAALQGFEDRLYIVFLDGVEQTSLDRQVFPGPDSTLVFLRLTFLAGA